MPPAPFRLGWEEWVALPDLRLPALKVKVDTGARTSALHASDIDPFGPASHPNIRFLVHPVPQRPDLVVACSAPIKDRREVTSSNGEAELRYVIETRLGVGGRDWPVELTLTDRGAMAYRMLLGRQAFPDDVVIAPQESFCQPQLDYDAYRGHARRRSADRPLRIALLGRWSGRAARGVIAEGEARGHEVRVIDPGRCAMVIDGVTQEIVADGTRLGHVDAVVARLSGASAPYGSAVLRQFDATGAWCMNAADGILSARDGLQACQLLARKRVEMPAAMLTPGDASALPDGRLEAPWSVRHRIAGAQAEIVSPTDAALRAAVGAAGAGGAVVRSAAGQGIRCLVAGSRVVATAARDGGPATRADAAERRLALKAARVFGLGLAAVDLSRTDAGPKVCGVEPCPDLRSLDRAATRSLVKAVVDTIETRCRSRNPGRAPGRRGAR